MSNEENKRYVSAGLQLRRAARKQAEQEARLEAYEQDMIDTCNVHCADARDQRRINDAAREYREQAEARRAARAEALAKAQAREDAAMRAVRYYGLACLVILWLAAWTHMPLSVGIALALGLAVILAAHVFRIYFPIKETANA